jgi:glycosyltransferase involved in cell wall biosynthesis
MKQTVTDGAPSLEAVLLESARLHAARASHLQIELARARSMPRLLRRAADSEAGHKVRFALLLAKRTGRALREEGLAGTAALVRARLRPVRAAADVAAPVGEGRVVETPGVEAGSGPRGVYGAPIGVSAGARFGARVLIVAELSVPQCAKYRVWQKKAHFERLGVACTVVNWRRQPEALSALAIHSLLILYRVGLDAGTQALMDEARRLGMEVVWEVDDLIFDVALYGANANLRGLSRAMRRDLLRGAGLYREAMLAADRTIGSTRVLSELMAASSGRPSHVVVNALDAETLDFADAAVAGRVRAVGRVVIAYGSGTLTHDADFAVAGPGLLRLLGEEPAVHLLILGSLNLPVGFDAFADRIERRGSMNFRAYLAALASADVSIAPLEETVFNDAKSNIKLVEASVVGLASVCSPRVEFRNAVTHGVDGFLADTDEGWFGALLALVRDPELRRVVGERARARVLAELAPARVAAEAVGPIVGLVPAEVRRGFRVLVVNIFFAPRTFGGATVIAEEMAERLAGMADTEVFVFTSHDFPAPRYTLKRYRARGADVIGVALPPHDNILDFDDPEVERAFADVLAAVGPDVVHIHCVQQFGAGVARACQRAAVPYVVTVHDAWWLCARQFMVTAKGTYCYQTTIDLKVCEQCMPHLGHLQGRMDILKQGLLGAAAVISPSASHAALYEANGVPAARLVVNRNGIRMPGRARPARAPGPLRFGYVGGNEATKGVLVVKAAFERLSRGDWVLRVVDNTLNLGYASFGKAWRTAGRVEFVPAYRQDGMDAFFEGIDVLLFPSQWKESFGLTVREALARDVWVIATDSGGAAEEIVPGVNGDLIPMGKDPAALVAAVTTLLDHPGRLAANPFKASLAGLDEQASELDMILRKARDAAPGPRRAQRAQARPGSGGGRGDWAAVAEQQDQ